MPGASLPRLSGRLAVVTGAFGTAIVATAGLAVQAQAVPAAGDQRPASAGHGLADHGLADHGLAGHGPRLAALRPAVPDASRAPKVSSVVPAQGAPGWTISLAGHRFTHVTSVSFGGASAAFTVIGSTRITATEPPGARSGPITVTTTGGSGKSPAFTVTPQQTLEPGETLPSTDALTSKDGHFSLTMQGNGNLVYGVAGTQHRLWAAGTAGNPGAYLTMLSNGNLVLYSASGDTTLWSAKTAGKGPARLVARTDGDLVTYRGSVPTWAANSFDNTLEPGETLQPGWFLSSGNGYQLTMRKDGILAETGSSGLLWSSPTSGHAGAAVTMRTTGNLAVHQSGTTLWASKTTGHQGARLVDQRNGVQAVRYRGKILWASGKSAPPPTSITVGKWPGKGGTAAAARFYAYPYPHPPACTNGGACVADKWAFYRGQCTSWVAYRLNLLNKIAFTNSYGGRGRWGDAVNWGPRARKLKITVNGTPAAGAVAWYGPTKAAPDGHVAYVEKVNSATSFVMSELNYDSDNGFWVHTITKATGDWPTGFIHFGGR
jgi:surface antigen